MTPNEPMGAKKRAQNLVIVLEERASLHGYSLSLPSFAEEIIQEAFLAAEAAARNAALEEAAKIADRECVLCARSRGRGTDLEAGATGASSRIAAAIRNLKELK